MQTLPQRSVRWVDWRGNPISGGMTANLGMESTVRSVAHAFTVISWATLERVVLREKGICVHCLIVVMVFLPMLESSALAFQFNTLIMLNEISVWLTSDVRNMK